jgi:deoxyribodipyrimidine photo-lyase
MGAMSETPASRESLLNDAPVRQGSYVLYWMQASQRAEDNPALETAVARANALALPVLCVFGLTAAYPEANLRHYAFMVEGLAETRASLEKRGVQLAVLRAEPDEAALALAGEAALVVCDCGYLPHQRAWRARVAREARCQIVQVEADAVVPVVQASRKAEWSAATLRPKILPLRDAVLDAGAERAARPKRDSLGIRIAGRVDALDETLLASLGLDASVAPVPGVRGGTSRARALLARFVRDKLPFYGEERNDPSLEGQSGLSPYLHFGQVSPVTIANAARGASHASESAREAFLEQLVVRRELACNFAAYAESPHTYACVPAWARKTLAAHARDVRPYQYDALQLEECTTHDPYWNAAMREMKITGRLHGYLRMYWGKKILEWSSSPAEAFSTALRLNNRYFLDGRDPSSLAGVAWCFGLHDRPWQERPGFGMVRYMNESGLRRKFDIEAWVRRVESRERAAPARAPTPSRHRP